MSLAAGKDDESIRLKRGEFVASIRYLSECFNWSHGKTQRNIDQLLEHSMILWVVPEVKALASERLKKCRSRIDQAVRDGCLEPYLADFTAAVKKAQQTPFLRGEGARGWRASFDWFVANHVNIYAVLEGKYDGPAAASNNGDGGGHASDKQQFAEEPGSTSGRRTSRGDPVYIPRQ